MISRRDAMKLGAAGLTALRFAQQLAPDMNASGTTFTNYSSSGGGSHRASVQPGPAPATDDAIILKWTLESSVDPEDMSFSYWTSAAVHNGVLYVGGADNFLYALDPNTGETYWRFELEGKLRDTPAVSDDSVFITTWEDSVYAISIETGAERWRYNITGQSSWGALVVDDVLYFSDGSRIFALGTQFGEKRWTFIAQGASIPMVNNGVLYTTSYTHLHAIDCATGEQIWELPNDEVSIVAPIFHDGAILIGSSNYSVYAIDPDSGEKLWTFTTAMPVSEFYESPNMRVNAVANKTLLASADQRLFAIDSTTGKERWRVEMDGIATPLGVICGDSVLVADDYLSVRDLESGTELWRDNRYWGNDILSRFSPTTINGGMVFSGYQDHYYAIGNLPRPRLIADATLRGAPAPTAVERGTAVSGDEIENVGETQVREGKSWTEVTIGGVTGWISTDAIDTSSFVPPENLEYVYRPGD